MLMRIMSLNTWAGCVDGLSEYIEEQAGSCSVICLQEVHRASGPNVPQKITPTDPGSRTTPQRPHLYDELQEKLHITHDGHYAPQLVNALHDFETTEFDIMFGNAMFWSKESVVPNYSSGMAFGQFGNMYQNGQPSAKSMQVATFVLPHYQLVIANVHGFWHENGKSDQPERYIQNAYIVEGIARQAVKIKYQKPTHALLIGDLNYTSKMGALRTLEKGYCFGVDGGRHLNRCFDIKDTRTKYYKKPIREADHAIASPQLPVKRMWVDPEAPSDHAALFVEIEL